MNETEEGLYNTKIVLRIGDYVALKLSPPEVGWLSSEGLLEDECFVTPDEHKFDDCIWEIHVQNQYSASREYMDALVQSKISRASNAGEGGQSNKVVAHESGNTEQLEQLQRAAQNERRLNEKLMSLKRGKPIAFGDPIQLRHVKSHKFLTVSGNVLARDERENMRVSLDGEGNSLSCLGLMPKYKFEKEGQAVTNKAEVMVRVHERPGEYLHASKNVQSVYGTSRSEVNCSLESSFWTVVLYQSEEDRRSKAICAGQLITLQDPDSLSCVTLQNSEDSDVGHKVIMSPQFQIRDIISEVNVGTNLLWLVEKAEVSEGGPIFFSLDKLTLRDLNTGLYLKLDDESCKVVKNKYDATHFEFISTQSTNSKSSHFIEEEGAVNLASGFLWLSYQIIKENKDAKSVSHCSSTRDKGKATSLIVSSMLSKKLGYYVHIGVQAVNMLSNLLDVTKQFQEQKADVREFTNSVKSAMSVLDNLAQFFSSEQEGKATRSDVAHAQEKDTFRLRQNMVREQGLLDALLDIIELTETDVFNQIQTNSPPKLRKKQRSSFFTLGSRSGGDQSTEEELDRQIVAPPRGKRRNSLQVLSDTLAQALGGRRALLPTANSKYHTTSSSEDEAVIETVGNLVQQSSAKRGSVVMLSNSDRGRGRRKMLPSAIEEDDEEENTKEGDSAPMSKESLPSQQMSQKALHVLLILLTDNFENQSKCADRFPVLLNQVKTQSLAVQCVEEMLKENLQILQTKLFQREIDIMVELLTTSEFNVTYLRLMQNTCRCPQGVDATQRMVANALFGANDASKESFASSPAPSNRNDMNRSGRGSAFNDRQLKSKLMISIVAEWGRTNAVDWGDLDIYCPHHPAKYALGYAELQEGIPELFLQWDMKGPNGEYNMNKLFHCRDKVPMSMVVSALRKGENDWSSAPPAAAGSPSNANLNNEAAVVKNNRRQANIYRQANAGNSSNNIVMIAQYKAQVAEYFNTQLFLVADLCLDRNYVSIGVLEGLYEYDVLLGMLKASFLPNPIKAAVCRIVRCLYVDREPQVATNFPRYIRTSAAFNLVNQSRLSQFEEDMSKQKYKFALLQKIISDYLVGNLNLNTCDELSIEMLEVLNALVDFGFYSSVRQLMDVLNPILNALYGHQKEKSIELSVNSSSEMKSHSYSAAAIMPSDYVYRTLSVNEDVDMLADSWKRKFFEATESLQWMSFVLIVVLVTVILVIVDIATANSRNIPFYIATTVFFGLEVLTRAFAYWLVRGKVSTFFVDSLNILDTLLVAADVIILSVGGRNSSAVRIVRLLRILRLARAFRASTMIANADKEKEAWILPNRYVEVNQLEADTVVSILRILSMIYDRIQDRNLDIVIKAFSVWQMRKEKGNVMEIYQEVLQEEEKISQEMLKSFDKLLLDMIMYSDKTLTSEALQLLMIHKSQRERFFAVADNVQIVCTPHIETACKRLGEILKELQRAAEMFEIWSELESDQDKAFCRRVDEILEEIKGILAKTNDDKTLAIRSEILVDEEVQGLLRNLDAMNIFMVLQNTLFDGGREELREPIRNILKACNTLVCYFVKNCEENQQVAFRHIDWFVERVDDGIDSAKVIRVILEGNRVLIKQCPRVFLNDFAHRIMTKGRKPEYLELFVGMTELSMVNGSRVPAIEAEISTYLTAREWKQYTLLWCVAQDTDDYRLRKRAMERYCRPNVAPPKEEELPSDLRYHIRVLILLASCNLGPKLHAVYPFNDVLAALLDDVTVFPVKKALANLLLEILRTSADRLEKSEYFWQFIEKIVDSWESITSEFFVPLSRSTTLRIQNGEWLEVCCGIVTTFFESFDLNNFNEVRMDKNLRLFSLDPKDIIQRLHDSARKLASEFRTRIGESLSEELNFAVAILQRHLDGEDNDDLDDSNLEVRETKLKQTKQKQQRASVVYSEIQQAMLRTKFKEFLSKFKETTAFADDDIIEFLESIPWTTEPVKSDVRFEPLVKKVTDHFRSMIVRSPLSRSIDEESVEVCIWFLKALRHMFEKDLGVSCDHFEDIDVEHVRQSKSVERLRTVLCDNGVAYLCLDLIAVGIDHELYLEAMKLLIALLLKRGGCADIQKKIFYFLEDTDSQLFFELIRDMVENLKSWTFRENEVQQAKKYEKPDDIIVLFLLQRLCEGAAINNRNQIREQSHNPRVINILEPLASYVGVLSRGESIANTYIAVVLLRCILRLVQGPCKGNQEQFVLHTELLVSLNRIIRSSRPSLQDMSSQWETLLEDLKESVIDVLLAIIEGQPESSLVFDRVSTTMDFSVLHLLIVPPEGDKRKTNAHAKYLVLAKTMNKNVDNLQASSKPDIVEQDIGRVEVFWNNSLKAVYFHIPDFIRDIAEESKVKAIENVQDLASRELKLADFVKQIKVLFRESSHQQFLKKYGLSSLWTVKYYITRFMFLNAVIMNCLMLAYYGSIDNGRAYTGAGESAAHHRLLSNVTVTQDDQQDQRRSHPVYVDNLLGNSYIPTNPEYAFVVLNCFQIILAFCTLVIFCTVQVPVTYMAEKERVGSKWQAAFRSILLDPLPLWYLVYFGVALIALFVNPLFISLLLLDWVVLDAATQDLLRAIHYPARQLITTLVLILICLNIFAGVLFVVYRQDVVTLAINDVWDALKLCISYGFRGEYGVDHEMEPTLGERMFLDVTFYFIILSILRHVFFAIIVDTFGKLRELKYEREMEERNSCFICGIERHDYDRFISPGSSTGFAHHRSMAHNPIFYLYFIMAIWHQSPTADTSLEMHVRDCLSRGDVSWFPTQVMQEAKTDNDEKIESVDSRDKLDHDKGGGKEANKREKGGKNDKREDGGGGGSPSRRRSTRMSVIHSDSSVRSKDHDSQQEMLDKMQVIQKQMARLLKVVSGGGNNIQSSVMTSTGSMPNDPSNPYLRSVEAVRNAMGDLSEEEQTRSRAGSASDINHTPSRAQSMKAKGPHTLSLASIDEAAAAATTQPTLESMNSMLQLLMQRVESMDKKYSRSHKFIRHRIRENIGGSGGVNKKTAKIKGPPVKMISNVPFNRQSQAEASGKSPQFNASTIPESPHANESYSSGNGDSSEDSDFDNSQMAGMKPSDYQKIQKARPQSAQVKSSAAEPVVLQRPNTAGNVRTPSQQLAGPPISQTWIG